MTWKQVYRNAMGVTLQCSECGYEEFFEHGEIHYECEHIIGPEEDFEEEDLNDFADSIDDGDWGTA